MCQSEKKLSSNMCRLLYEQWYNWTLKFPAVVRQQILGAVAGFYSTFLQFISECLSDRIIKICSGLPKLSPKTGWVFYDSRCIMFRTSRKQCITLTYWRQFQFPDILRSKVSKYELIQEIRQTLVTECLHLCCRGNLSKIRYILSQLCGKKNGTFWRQCTPAFKLH